MVHYNDARVFIAPAPDFRQPEQRDYVTDGTGARVREEADEVSSVLRQPKDRWRPRARAMEQPLEDAW